MAKIKDLDVQEKSSILGPESGLWIFHFGVWICKSWQGFAVYIYNYMFFSLAGARSPLCTPTPIGGLWPACMFCFVMLAGCLFCRSTHIQAKVPHPQCGGGGLGISAAMQKWVSSWDWLWIRHNARELSQRSPQTYGGNHAICHWTHEWRPCNRARDFPGWFAPTFPHSMFLKLLLGNMFAIYI